MRYEQIQFNGVTLIHQFAEANDQGRSFPVNQGKVAMDVAALILKGKVSRTIKETGEKLEDRGPGWFSLENTNQMNPDQTCTIDITYPESSEVIFFPQLGNEAAFSKLTLIRLKANETCSLTVGNAYFLASGALSKDEQSFTGPAALPTFDTDVSVKALSDVYIFNFGSIVK